MVLFHSLMFDRLTSRLHQPHPTPLISGHRSDPQSNACMSPFMPISNLVVLEVMIGDCRLKRSLWVKPGRLTGYERPEGWPPNGTCHRG